MRIMKIPRGIKSAAAAVFLTVPTAATQTVIMARAPWWALPVRSMETSALWALGISAVVALLLLRGARGVYWIIVASGALWVFFGALVAIRTRNPGMGFLTIFVGVYFGLLTSWVRYEFGRSFFDPAMSWFEGAPRPIPAIACDLMVGDKSLRMKVSRLDEEGAFLFGKKIVKTAQKTELLFRFRDREIRCTGIPMIAFKRASEGVGFRFEGNTPDQKKDLGDFIETLRGEGYV